MSVESTALAMVMKVIGQTGSSKADLVDGKVPASQLPSYVDDTIEGYYYNGNFYEDSEHTTAITGESGKIYIDLTASKSYRWTGNVYVRIDECPAFGETQGTIYEGNKGKQNADAISAIKDGTTIDSFADVETALANKANTSDLGAAAAKGFDANPTSGNTNNAVSSDGVANALVPITAELVELADSGAKNLCSVESVSASGGSGFTQIYRFDSVIPAGNYIVSFDGTTSDSVAFSLVDTNDNRIAASQFNFNQSDLPMIREISISVAATGIQLYKNSAISFSNIMLCTKSAWDISHKFVPYCPSMAEMYAMIQALQT